MPVPRPSPTVAPITDPAAFLAVVRASKVADGPALDAALAALPAAAATAAAVSDHLIKTGVLTRFQAGRLLAGKPGGFVLGVYVILEPIGAGPAGRVFKARHRAMNRLAAVKVLAPDTARSADAVAAFQADARAAARLTHPNVVTVWDVNEFAGRHYVVREFVNGESATVVVRRGGPLGVAAAADVARQAALGLAHAHDRGLAHGSFSPADVLIVRDAGGDHPPVKVANFGADRGPADAAADVAGLGRLLTFLLLGREPGPGVPLEAVRPDVPPALTALVRELGAGPGLTAAAVAARLEPFTGPEPGGVRVEFSLPAADGSGVDWSGTLTTVLPPSPWAGLAADPGDAAGPPTVPMAGATPVEMARPGVPAPARRPWYWPFGR